MITVQNQTWAFLGGWSGSTNEIALTNCGTWLLPEGATYVAGWTNAPVDITGLRDGSMILVDAGGTVFVSRGSDLPAIASYGFGTAMLVLGTFIGVRYMYRVFLAGAGVPRSEV